MSTLSNISSVRSFLKREAAVSLWLAEKNIRQDGSAVGRLKSSHYFPFRSILGRIQVVFSGSADKRMRAADRLNKVCDWSREMQMNAPTGDGIFVSSGQFREIATKKFLVVYGKQSPAVQKEMLSNLSPAAVLTVISEFPVSARVAMVKQLSEAQNWADLVPMLSPDVFVNLCQICSHDELLKRVLPFKKDVSQISASDLLLLVKAHPRAVFDWCKSNNEIASRLTSEAFIDIFWKLDYPERLSKDVVFLFGKLPKDVQNKVYDEAIRATNGSWPLRELADVIKETGWRPSRYA